MTFHEAFPKRMGRLEFITWVLILRVANLAIFFVALAVAGFPHELSMATFSHAALISLLCLLGVDVFFLLPRRCHDIGWDCGTVLLAFVPVVNLAFGAVLALCPGTVATPDYGPKPPTRSAFTAIYCYLKSKLRRGCQDAEMM
jgi:uncharacterized membrane protein YhaH (DUF805 family)